MSAEKFGGQMHLFRFQVCEFGISPKIRQKVIVKRVKKKGCIRRNQNKNEGSA